MIRLFDQSLLTALIEISSGWVDSGASRTCNDCYENLPTRVDYNVMIEIDLRINSCVP